MSDTNKLNATITIAGDLTVNRMGFGAMRITGKGVWGPPKDKDSAIKVLQKTVDLGIDFIDTADSYGPNVSEELIAEALYPYPEGLIIATKGGLTRPGPDQWNVKADPDYLEGALKGSLKRLKVDRIDLYQLHRFDPKVPMEETLGKLKELQGQGFIRHLGLSEVTVEQLEKASQIIEVVSVQNRYSMTNRQWEDVLQWSEANNAAFIPWYPLDAGVLDNPAVQKIAAKHEATVYQIALAWLLEHSQHMLPIPGTSSVAHLQENVGAANIQLDTSDMATLDEIGN